MNYEPITQNRKKLQADFLRRQKRYAVSLQDLFAQKPSTTIPKNIPATKGAN